MYQHQPVMLEEVVKHLVTNPDGFYVDATFGRGGHSTSILSRLSAKGRLLGLDRDPDVVPTAKKLAEKDQRFSWKACAFSELHQAVQELGWQGRVTGVLLDIGVSSPQLDNPERGFSFRNDGPLDMRMDPQAGLSAAEWINTADEQDIRQVLWTYGEERFARRIAKAIVDTRDNTPFTRTKQLADVIVSAKPIKEKNKHAATRTFQAIRLFINRELDELLACLQHILEILTVAGRLLVISFHSLEDRLVKRFIRQSEQGDPILAKLPVLHSEKGPYLRKVGKAIKPSASEVAANPRARSAILRIAEKVS